VGRRARARRRGDAAPDRRALRNPPARARGRGQRSAARLHDALRAAAGDRRARTPRAAPTTSRMR
jgi:hypothetical protein